MKKLLITKRLTALVWTLVLTLMPMSLMADNTPLSVTVTFEVGSFVYEQAGNAFDGKPETKWCGGILTTNNTNAYVQVQLAEKSKLDYYYLYTGNDINYKDDDSQQQRNPKEWKLYAKVNEGDEWTLISHVTDAGLPTTVCTRSNNYKIDAAYQNIEYNYLKFEILQVEQGTIFEVGEICFINCNHTFGSDDICTECGYEKQQDDGFVTVASASQMYNVISGNDHAKVRLTQDIYLSDLGADFEDTFCSTFYGILDGDGHAIKGDHYADGTTQRRNRTYLFTYSDGATFKNLTFKHIQKNSDDHENQAIITSQAKNHCVFENITFDNVGTHSKKNNVAAAAGTAEDCTFTNITVKNSDFTVTLKNSGTVVGNAKNCTFTNIKVENCKTGTSNDVTGGVVGYAYKCTFYDIEIIGSRIYTNEIKAGGIVGESSHSEYANCTIDDQSLVFVEGRYFSLISEIGGYAGGIVAYSSHDHIQNCVNSALIACDVDETGGIVGHALETSIESCLNTGMVVVVDDDDINDYYNKYKNKQLPCVTKYYNGKEYVVRKTELADDTWSSSFGGIAGCIISSTLSKCANIGSMSGTKYAGGLIGLTYDDDYIHDCISDVETPSNIVYGLIGMVANNYNSEDHRIISCLNVTNAKDYVVEDDDKVIAMNNFSYKSNTLEINELTWGKVCLLLRDNWQQNIGTDPYPTPTGDKAIYHSRTITNEYGTAYLPFSVDSDDNISFYTFKEETPGAEGINLKFTYVDHVPAHTPVLFRASGSPTPEDTVNITINDAHGDYVWRDKYSPASGWGMEGTYKQRVIDGNEAKSTYYLSGGVFKNAAKVNLPSCRAYLHGPSIDELTANNAQQAKAIRFVLQDEDGTTTALELFGNDLVPVQQNGKVYTIMGTEANKNYHGIVIKNGRKTLTPALSL